MKKDLLLCFPKRLQRCLSSTSWMQLVVWLLSPLQCELLPLQMSGSSWRCGHCPQDTGGSSSTSWAQLDMQGTAGCAGPLHPPGAVSCLLGLCFPQALGYSEWSISFWDVTSSVNKVCVTGRNSCSLLLLWPFTIGVQEKISSKVKWISSKCQTATNGCGLVLIVKSCSLGRLEQPYPIFFGLCLFGRYVLSASEEPHLQFCFTYIKIQHNGKCGL